MISNIQKTNHSRRKLFKESSIYVGHDTVSCERISTPDDPLFVVPTNENNINRNYNRSRRLVNDDNTNISSRNALSNRYNRHHVLHEEYEQAEGDLSLSSTSQRTRSRYSPIHGRSIDHQQVQDLLDLIDTCMKPFSK